MLSQAPLLQISPPNKLIAKYFSDAAFRLEQTGFSLENLEADFKKRTQQLQGQSYDRKKLAQTIESYMSSFGLSNATKSLLQDLEKDNSVCVVTGQQPALMGGPLYNLYKAASVIQLAKQLKEKTGVPVVPIFWIGGNDADVMEANRFYYTDTHRRLKKFTNKGWDEMPLNHIKVSACFNELKKEVSEQIGRIDFLKESFDFFAPEANDNLSDWFCRILTRFFGEEGLLFVEPKMLISISEKAFHDLIDKENDVLNCIQDNSSRLSEQGYVVQVDPTVSSRWMRYQSGRGRKRFDRKGNDYVLYGETYTPESLLKLALTEDKDITPDALLRPLWQDIVLPTAIYCAGSGEIAYYHQLRNCYEIFGRKMPILLPRLSGTILEKNHLKFLHKQELKAQEFYLLKELVPMDAPDSQLTEDLLASLISKWQKNIQDADEKKIFDRFKAKMEYVHTRFFEKLEAQRRNHAGWGKKQMEEWKDFVFPRQLPQERVLSAFVLMARHGVGFFDFLKTVPYQFNSHFIYSIMDDE